MKIGISAGAGIEAYLPPLRADALERAVTEHILALADQAGFGAALIDAGPGEVSVITWPQFAHTVRTAARGLSGRGLAEADTAAIFVQDAVSHVLAVHAVRAAGAIAAPVCPAQTAADLAAQLKQGRARLLITAAGLAELAIQAAERSWVRQVFAFGEAEGTTPFSSLLHTAKHGQPAVNGHSSQSGHASRNGRSAQSGHPSLNGHNGLNGGYPVAQVLGFDGPVCGLTGRDVVVAAPPCGDPGVYTSLLDAALAAGASVVAVPLAYVAAAVGAYKGTAAIVPRGTDVPGLPVERVFAVD